MLKSLHNFFQAALNDCQAANSHLKDENTLLKAQASAAFSHPPSCPPPPDDARAKEYEQRMHQLAEEAQRLRNKMAADEEAHARTVEELETLKKDQDDLLVLLADQVCFFWFTSNKFFVTFFSLTKKEVYTTFQEG